MVIDWSAGGNTWNYYKAVVNTRIVGYQISQCVIITSWVTMLELKKKLKVISEDHMSREGVHRRISIKI